MMGFYTGGLIFGVSHWGLYSEVYAWLLLDYNGYIESFEWFELDILT
jgi:hypothetical protein